MVRAVLADAAIGTTWTRSDFEEAFIVFCDDQGFERPRMNHRVDAITVDGIWIEPGIVVELDPFSTHGSRASFETDRLRDRYLQVRALRPIRVTPRELMRAPERLAGDLLALGVPLRKQRRASASPRRAQAPSR